MCTALVGGKPPTSPGGNDCESAERESGGHSTADPTEPESAAAVESKLSLVSGDNSLRDPPVPIPNTEVKPQHADSTWLETAR